MTVAATRRDVDRLIGAGINPDEALSRGLVEREKVQGHWIYFPPDCTVNVGLGAAEAAVTEVLDELFVTPARYLIGVAAKRSAARDMGLATLTVLVHELCARGRLCGLALLTRARQPYLAHHLPRDSAEVDRQIAFMRERVSTAGRITWRELPDPEREVAREAWRMTVLQHGEWAGVGWLREAGDLIGW